MMMRPALSYRHAFFSALIDPAADACPPAFDPLSARRFRIYRNNVYSSLISALADAYPVVQRLVGEEFFSAMAREFIRSETERAPTLADYGAGFPDFIAQFTPAASVVYLADMARLERARLQALNAADAKPLDAAKLPRDGARLLTAKLIPHPALQIVNSQHPVYTIWLANQDVRAESLITAASEGVLLTRSQYAVQMYLLDATAMIFTNFLIQGLCIQQAYEQASALSGTLNIEDTFSLLLQAGAFIEIHFPEEFES